MAQWSRKYTALAEDPHFVPCTLVFWITNACNYSCRGSDTSAGTCLKCTDPQMGVCTQLELNLR